MYAVQALKHSHLGGNVRTVHNGKTLSHLGPQTMYAQFTMALKHYHI